ncbi:glycosyltransferase [Gorillibacterium sp. sgz500922]|uniref:glycosyltransferase n=1 Tax=Gorillibacterium sp. sgz500922 TaxID=3446694 RepID=UPI003F66C72D
MKRADRPGSPQAVSILTCTKRFDCMENLLRNYGRQTYRNKELIILLHGNRLDRNAYDRAARPYGNVRIYRVPESFPLGKCLRYGVTLARFGHIAKFDDDDYYAPRYLSDSMRAMEKSGADLVGKRAHYMYLEGRKLLLLRHARSAGRFVPVVPGATLLVKRRVFKKVSFSDRRQGECVKFCSDCRAKGYRIYSGKPNHFVAVRRKNSNNHTWMISDRTLLKRDAKALRVKDYRTFAARG